MFPDLMRSLRHYAEKDGRGYPDWAFRYLPILRRFRGRPWTSQRLLEVGANENGLARFTGAPVVAIDIAHAHLKAARATQNVLPVVADIGALPFADDLFDAVVCMDTYEHIPKPHRNAANSEILRVLRQDGVAAIGFPSGDDSSKAETRVRTAYHDLTGDTIRWLEEHVDMGLPDGAEVAEHLAGLAESRYDVERTGNATLWAWEWMWRILMCNWPGRGNALAQVALRWSVPILSRLHFGRCYRAMIWVAPKGPRS
jgi:SAM-dependent methyltransferase